MLKSQLVLVLAALTGGGEALAQSTNCMSIGGGMVHCDTTPDMSQPQAGGTGTLSLLAGAIARSNERSLQKKMGEMVAKGDCNGAAKLAYSKGRIELGNQVRASCQPSESAAAPSPLISSAPDLEARLRLAAAKANAAVPTPLDDVTTATKVEAVGTQILISATVNVADQTLTEPVRSNVRNQICANPSSPELLKAGASIRIQYADGRGHDMGSVMVTRAECGL